jgi:triosephosphate isomerase
MRKPLIAGNWKMHGTQSVVKTLIDGIKAGASAYSSVEILVIPTFVHLSLVHNLLSGSAIKLGAQNLLPGEQGAFTGEVGGSMLKDSGCTYVLVGHSERRTLFHDDLPTVAEKFVAAQAAGLIPILCIGETQAEREAGKTNSVILGQLDSVIARAGMDAFKQAVIAYEPVWAIGTGLTATPEQAQEVHAVIRQHLAQNQVDIADTIRILYGGSMKPANAASLLTMPDIDGGLIGGASLDAASFLAICDAANKEMSAA